MLIDSHVNLHAPQFDADRRAVIERARAAGVGVMVEICDRVANFGAVHSLALAHADIWATVGTHPHEVKSDLGLSADILIELANGEKVVGIGETGLDFHYEFSPGDAQKTAFRIHIAAARMPGLTLIVHGREADEAMAEILEEEHARGAF